MDFSGFSLTKRKTGEIVAYDANTGIHYYIEPTDANFGAWKKAYESIIQLSNSLDRATSFTTFLEALRSGTATATETPKSLTTEEILKRGVTNAMNFFKEFSFEPSFRFMNTFAIKASTSKESAKDYVVNYFSLMDNQFKGEIKGKMRSQEFKGIIDDIAKYGAPTKTINNRLAIYYGSAGTGKTTLGMQEANNRCIVCNSSMLPSDLMEDFVFQDGKPTFQKSALWESMEQGKAIVFDEINLLPYDSLRFLQGILDGKAEVDYKGNIIPIKEGFKIIGTMNLSLGGMVYGLPEPLVDRCYDIKEFKLTPTQLMKAIMA